MDVLLALFTFKTKIVIYFFLNIDIMMQLRHRQQNKTYMMFNHLAYCEWIPSKIFLKYSWYVPTIFIGISTSIVQLMLKVEWMLSCNTSSKYKCYKKRVVKILIFTQYFTCVLWINIPRIYFCISYFWSNNVRLFTMVYEF